MDFKEHQYFKKVLIGIDEAYTRDKIKRCFENRLEYKVDVISQCTSNREDLIKQSYDFYWLEYEDIDFEKYVNSKEKVLLNSYCIRKGLIRKAQIAFQLKKYISKKPDSSLKKYLPETHVFELDYLDYLDEALNDVFELEIALKENLDKKVKNEATKKFILKSSMTNKGAEILIFDSRAQLEAYFQRRIDTSEDELLDLREWVIQEYIDKPLQLSTYRKRKFHLRVYVIAVGKLKVYVYSDILALFSFNPYKQIERINDDEMLQLGHELITNHITNTCFQLDNYDQCRSNRDEVENECVKRFWSLNFDESDANKNLQKQNLIFNQIKDCVGKIFECLVCEPTVFQPIENAFELYGFDFLVDENYTCYFLEANAFPDFKQTGDALNDLIDCLFYQTIALTSDKYFNFSPVCDTNKMNLVFDSDSFLKENKKS